MSAGPREQTTQPAREVIQAAIEKHMWCECPDGGGYNPKHAAAAVVEALGLTEEWAHTGKLFEEDDDELDEWSCGHQIITPTRYGVVHEGFDTPVRRWVSGWSVVGGEPSE